jgi:hypothetical protein
MTARGGGGGIWTSAHARCSWKPTRTASTARPAGYLKRWCTAALRSCIPAYETPVRRIRKHFDAIVTAVQLGLSNSRLEGINAKIRLIHAAATAMPTWTTWTTWTTLPP